MIRNYILSNTAVAQSVVQFYFAWLDILSLRCSQPNQCVHTHFPPTWAAQHFSNDCGMARRAKPIHYGWSAMRSPRASLRGESARVYYIDGIILVCALVCSMCIYYICIIYICAGFARFMGKSTAIAYLCGKNRLGGHTYIYFGLCLSDL